LLIVPVVGRPVPVLVFAPVDVPVVVPAAPVEVVLDVPVAALAPPVPEAPLEPEVPWAAAVRRSAELVMRPARKRDEFVFFMR